MARVTSSYSPYSVFILWLGIFLRVASAEVRGPPKISEQVTGFRKVDLGRSVRLPCPVTGNPPPLTMWTKDGDTIHQGWDRFRVKSEGLKINKVVQEDAGLYICRATNGFGSVSLNYTLTVTDGTSTPDRRDDSDQPEDVPTIEDGVERPTSGTMPQFSEEGKMVKAQKLMKPLNSSVRLKCKASGYPRPEIFWEKDGRVVTTSGKQYRQYTLKLSQLKPEDSGTYTCIVHNKHGRINATYQLDVVDKIKRKPDLLGEHPVNTTVVYGGSTSFQCRVRSDIVPHIQWLKRMEPDSPRTNSTIKMDDQYFEVLPSGDVLPRPDGSYLNKLMISFATAEDAGMYICLGANTMGYSFKSAFLTVLPDPNPGLVPDIQVSQTPRIHALQDEVWGNVEQGLLIGIPISLAVIFVVIVIICTVSRNKNNRRGRGPGAIPPPQQIPNPSVKRDYPHRDYLNHANLSKPHMMDIEQCAPLTAAQCGPIASQQTLHIYPVTTSRENVLNRYDVVHSPSSFTDTLNSTGSLNSSRANTHHHLHHQHTILHC